MITDVTVAALSVPFGTTVFLEACYCMDMEYRSGQYFARNGTLRGYRELSRRGWWRSLLARDIRLTLKILSALRAFGDAQFECGEWDRNDSPEPYDVVLKRARVAEDRLWGAIRTLWP